MKVNSHPTLLIPRSFTFLSIPTIFIHPNDCSTRLRETRAVLLAAAGGESPDPTPVRNDAPTDLGAAGADRLTGDS